MQRYNFGSNIQFFWNVSPGCDTRTIMRTQQVVTVVGAHAEGEVGRVITGGVIAPRASSMFERQQLLERDQDWLRLMLLSDPRGSVNAAVNLITPPIAPEA